MARGVGKPPSGDDLWAEVTAQDKRRIASYNRSPAAGGNPIINRYDYAEAVAKTGISSPFSAIPVSASKGQFSAPAYEVIPFFGYDGDDVNAPSMEYYSFDDEGFEYKNNSLYAQIDESPAPITIVPTSTTDPERPRTVAAGYDPAQQKVTVIFRDGTYYNYFEVENREWQNFKRARSKGRFIKTYFDNFKPRGRADVNTIPPYARETVYRFLRTGQSFRGGYQPGQSTASKRGSGYKPGNLGGTGRKRLNKAAGQTGGTGGNAKP